MPDTLQEDVTSEVADLAIELSEKLEEAICAKEASDQRVRELEAQLADRQDSVAKSASQPIPVPPSLFGSLYRLETAGLVKAGGATQVYEAIKESPEKVFEFINTISGVFPTLDSEGAAIDKEASDTESLPEGATVDQDGWHKLLDRRKQKHQ